MIVSEMVGVGVVGFGNLGQYLVEKIKQNQDGKQNLHTVIPFFNTEFNPTANFNTNPHCFKPITEAAACG
jgi:homoserine dehydrogenase